MLNGYSIYIHIFIVQQTIVALVQQLWTLAVQGSPNPSEGLQCISCKCIWRESGQLMTYYNLLFDWKETIVKNFVQKVVNTAFSSMLHQTSLIVSVTKKVSESDLLNVIIWKSIVINSANFPFRYREEDSMIWRIKVFKSQHMAYTRVLFFDKAGSVAPKNTVPSYPDFRKYWCIYSHTP